MTTIAKSAALVATFALSMTIGTTELLATPTDCQAIAVVKVNGEQIALPEETAEHVTMLQQHGARYAKVIALIVEENAKPDWTFAEGCSPKGADVLAKMD